MTSEPTATGGGTPMKINSGVIKKPPPTPNMPEIESDRPAHAQQQEHVDRHLCYGQVNLEHDAPLDDSFRSITNRSARPAYIIARKIVTPSASPWRERVTRADGQHPVVTSQRLLVRRDDKFGKITAVARTRKPRSGDRHSHRRQRPNTPKPAHRKCLAPHLDGTKISQDPEAANPIERRRSNERPVANAASTSEKWLRRRTRDRVPNSWSIQQPELRGHGRGFGFHCRGDPQRCRKPAISLSKLEANSIQPRWRARSSGSFGMQGMRLSLFQSIRG